MAEEGGMGEGVTGEGRKSRDSCRLMPGGAETPPLAPSSVAAAVAEVRLATLAAAAAAAAAVKEGADAVEEVLLLEGEEAGSWWRIGTDKSMVWDTSSAALFARKRRSLHNEPGRRAIGGGKSESERGKKKSE